MEYLLKSILCLLLLMLLYRVLLQRDVLYRFNRFYLLGALFVSFFIPLLSIEVPAEQPIYFESVPQMGPADLSINPTEVVSENFPWAIFAWVFYGLISFIFLLRFVRNLKLIWNQVHQNVQIDYQGETLVLLNEPVAPFSFLSYIFISNQTFQNEGISDAVFAHEQCHIREKHSWDILLVEFLMIGLWFHPGLYLLRQSICLNHEFIADQEALKTTTVTAYKQELISAISGGNSLSFTSHFTFSLTKKRLKMMTKKTSSLEKWAKYLAILPMMAAVIYLFADRVFAQKSENSISSSKLYSFASNSPTETQGLKNYLSLYGQFQTKTYVNHLLTMPSEEEIKILEYHFRLLEESYFRLSIDDRRKVKRGTFPFAKINKNGKITYKKWVDLTEEEKKNLGC